MTNYEIIEDAIERKLQVIALYGGHRREMCPHVLGLNKQGQQRALFYQYGGTSDRALEPLGSPDNWRCFAVDELEILSVNEGPWYTGEDGGHQPKCIARVRSRVTLP